MRLLLAATVAAASYAVAAPAQAAPVCVFLKYLDGGVCVLADRHVVCVGVGTQIYCVPE